MADRDCNKCKHYEWTSDHTVQGCSVWECEFEPKEGSDEQKAEKEEV